MTFSASEMDEDRLCACVSLPMWFPPIPIDGDEYIDGVYVTDANVEEAIRRGADEIWCIWTVSTRGDWGDGFVNNYFQIIEAAANGHFKRICARIEANNALVAQGKNGEFGRPIEFKLLQAEVPIHYLVNFSQDRLVECVNLGVQTAREWCRARGLALRPGGVAPTEVHTVETELQFTEVIKGFVATGEADYDAGYARGKASDSPARFELTIKMDGVNRFITDPKHEAVAEGWFECAAFGGRRPVSKGTFNRTRDEDGGGKVLATGILKIYLADFLKQLTTFRVEGPTMADRAPAFARFGGLFLGKLWNVYAVHVLPYGPI